MNDCERKAEAILALTEVFRAPISDAALSLYVAAVGDLTAADVTAACARLIGVAKFRPTPAEIREEAGAGGAAVSDRAMLAFAKLESAIGSVGIYKSPNFDDPLINGAVRMLGGWERVCAMECEEFDKWFRKEFERTYQILSRVGVSCSETGALVGILERENRGLGFDRNSRVDVDTGLPWVGEHPKLIEGKPTNAGDDRRLIGCAS